MLITRDPSRIFNPLYICIIKYMNKHNLSYHRICQFFFTHDKSHIMFDIQQALGLIPVKKENIFTNVMNVGKGNGTFDVYIATRFHNSNNFYRCTCMHVCV